jgi:hypothetical protein
LFRKHFVVLESCGVVQLIAFLRTPNVKGWPQQLTTPVEKEGGNGVAKVTAPAIPTPKKLTAPAAVEEPATMETKPIAQPEEPPTALPSTTPPALAPALAPASSDSNLSRDVQRVLVRAVVGMGAKINTYEAQLSAMNTQLEQLEAFALAVQQAVVRGSPRPTFESLQQSLYGSGGAGGQTML